MALYLNLYHEIQKQKLQRQRDPLKIGIMVLLFIALIFVGYYLWRMGSASHAKSELARVQSEWSATEPKEKAATTRKNELDVEDKLKESLVHKIENRFYWAPLLDKVVHIVPSDVQITGFDGSVTNTGPKKITLSITGMATGAQPRSVAEDLRTTLQSKFAADYQQATSVFQSLDDSTESVQFEGKTTPVANFVITVSFTSPDISDTGTPKPVRAKK